ncbi:TPA: AAA family ATPase [archaeon]|nr:AAA family ATPase [Candidatus Naiadarchaeales archaeon SRR2090153.bin461]
MLRKIKLHNWKAHAESEFNFSGGTNVIVGQMGAGKSSILQAVSFALFGTFSELKSKDLKISDLVSRNAEIKTASIELELALANKIFQIKRVVEEGSTKEAVLRDGEGRLLAGTNPAQVNMYLKDILKIDEDVFLRTIYAKQNEIDLFLQLRPNERKARLDEMMFIDKFENARKNCVKLGNQIEARKNAHEELVRDFRIEELEKEIAGLENDCTNLQKEKENLQLKAAEVEKEKANIDSKIKSLRKVFEERSRLEEKKQLLEKQLEELKEKLQSAELDEDVNAIIAKSDAIKTKISENQKSKLNIKDDLDLHRSNALDLERNLGILENKSAELSEQLKKSERLRVELRELEAYGNILFLQCKIKYPNKNKKF